MCAMTIYEQLEALGVPLDSHGSDLYALVMPVSICVVQAYELRAQVRTFTSGVDGRLWFEIPSAYQPFRDERTRTESATSGAGLV